VPEHSEIHFVSLWFISVALARAVCQICLPDTIGSLYAALDVNIITGVLLIITSWIPLLSGYALTNMMGFKWLDIIEGVTIQPVIWTQLLLWIASHWLAWTYKFVMVCIRILRYRIVTSGTRADYSDCEGFLKKVLIIHASVGAGHKRAAQAVKEAFEIQEPAVQVTVLDVCDIGGTWFNTIYKHSYMSLVDRKWGSFFVGYLFELGNEEPPGCLKRIVEEMFLLDFIEYLYKHDFNLVIHTHFLALEILAAMRRRRVWNTRHVCVVTDFDTHAYWAVGPVERFFVAREEAKLGLTHHGVPSSSVCVTGIPIVPAFAKCPDRNTCMHELNIEGKRPVVLLVSWGESVVEAYEVLLQTRTPLEIVVITGRQADISAQLEVFEVPLRHRTKLEGFTTVIERYMRAADILITKPGGLTTAEAMASGLAMVVVAPYPGQEVRNTEMLLEEGCAIKCSDLYMLAHKVEKLLAEPERVPRMRQCAQQLGRPRAAFEIVDSCMELGDRPLQATQSWMESDAEGASSSDEDMEKKKLTS